MSALVVLLRHAETEDGEKGNFPGLDTPLSASGRAQTQDLAARIKDVPIVSLTSSDLPRAVATADILAGTFGSARREVDCRLREIDIGDWAGSSLAEVVPKYGEEFQRWWDGSDVARGGGETYEQTALRMAAAVEAIAATPGLHLVVSHAFAIYAYARHVLRNADYESIRWPLRLPDNLSATRVAIAKSKHTLASYSEVLPQSWKIPVLPF